MWNIRFQSDYIQSGGNMKDPDAEADRSKNRHTSVSVVYTTHEL